MKKNKIYIPYYIYKEIKNYEPFHYASLERAVLNLELKKDTFKDYEKHKYDNSEFGIDIFELKGSHE